MNCLLCFNMNAREFGNHTLTELVLKNHIWSQRCPYETEKRKE